MNKKAKIKKCDRKCLDKIRGVLLKQYAEVELELKQFIDTNSFEMGSDFPPLYFTYRDGKKRKRSYVGFNYCPFCGGQKL